MTRSEIRTAIKQLLVRVLKLQVAPDSIGDRDLLFDGSLGLDSLVAMEILIEIEETFGIQLEDQKIDQNLFRSVDSMARIVDWHLNAAR